MRKSFLSVTLILALTFLVAGIFAGCENCAHEYGAWETLSAATCEKTGEKERVCKKCGEVETDEIAALEHLFDENFTTDVEPTAESEGERSRHCLHEGCKERTDIQTIPKLTDEGGQKPQNPNKNEESKPQIPDKDEEDPGESEEPTPQQPENEPQNPNEDEEPQNPNEDEEPQNPNEDEEPQNPDVEEDESQKPDEEEPEPQIPDEEEDGPRIPDEEEDETPDHNEEQTPIPQNPVPQDPVPEEDLINYRIYINRWNGFKFYYDPPKISIYDSEEKQVFSDFIGIRQSVVLTNEEEYCMRDIPLPMGDYTIKIDYVTKGFVHEDSYAMSYRDGTSPYDTEDKYPTVDIRLGCDMDEGGDVLEVGKVMKDFTFPTVNNKGTVTLRELLENYDLLIVNVYYNNCIYCRQEAPVLNQILEKYPKVGFVCINQSDSESATLSGITSTFHFDLDRIYLVCNKKTPVLGKIKGVTGVPRNFFIDKEGFVARGTGGVTEEWAERIIRLNMTESREAHGKLYSATEKKEPATLCPVLEIVDFDEKRGIVKAFKKQLTFIPKRDRI